MKWAHRTGEKAQSFGAQRIAPKISIASVPGLSGAFSVLRHLRVLNCLIAAVGVFVGFSVASGHLAFSLKLFAGMVSAAAITGAGNLINDFFDIETDRRAGKHTPLVDGNTHPMLAFGGSVVLFIAGILLALKINQTAFDIAVLVSALMILYSSIMRNHKYIGNIVVAAGTALAIVFGASIAQNYLWAGIFAFSAFLANIGRELTKDLEDMDSDRDSKKTLPMILGFSWTRRIVFFMYATAITVAGTAWASGIVKGAYFIVLLLLCAIVFFMAWEKLEEKQFAQSQKYSKYAMIVSLLAFISVVL